MVDKPNSEPQRIGRFDQVRILTTKNVTYLSAPPGTKVQPQGLWSVAAAIGNQELLLVKKSAVIRIPVTDVLKMTAYDLPAIVDRLGRLIEYGKERKSGQGQEAPDHSQDHK